MWATAERVLIVQGSTSVVRLTPRRLVKPMPRLLLLTTTIERHLEPRVGDRKPKLLALFLSTVAGGVVSIGSFFF